MAGRIVLYREAGSVKFNDRVLTLSGEPAKVGRASKEERPDTSNAVFDCKVLSKTQAEFKFDGSHFYLRDTGSSNGSFINNFRLSKPGQNSSDNKLYSQDIIRFGSEVLNKSKMVKEKCVVAKIQIYLPCGEEYDSRPTTDKLYRQLEDIKIPEKQKQVSFAPQNELMENKVERIEKMMTTAESAIDVAEKDLVGKMEKKLKRKQSEIINLIETINKCQENEKMLDNEVKSLKELLAEKTKEAERLSDNLALKTKEQMDNIRVTDLKSELDDVKNMLKKTTDENWIIKEKLRIDQENIVKKDHEISKLSIFISELESTNQINHNKDNDINSVLKADLQKCVEELEANKYEIKQLTSLVTKADEIVKEKEQEILFLNNLAHKDQLEIKEKENDYINLKCLMTEENETVHQIESEMKRMINIIAEDQEALTNKENMIISLQNELKEKVGNPISGEVCQCKEKDLQINKLRDELETLGRKLESEKFCLKVELEDFKSKQEMKIHEFIEEREKQASLISDELRSKIEELMQIIEDKNEEISQLKSENEGTESASSRIEILQKETLALKMSLQQKDLDIKSLHDLINRKEEIINQNDSAIEQYIEEVNNLRKQNTDKNLENDTKDNNLETVKELQDKINAEQESHKQTESELINLKLELESLRTGIKSNADEPIEESVEEGKSLMKVKDEEIERLRKEIAQEQQIVAHVQVTQEKEIMEKEKEIFILNTILTQERKVLLEKEKEVERLSKTGVEKRQLDGPQRPLRSRQTEAQPICQAQAFLTQAPSDEDSDTVTFHDALSEDEDIMIEDLEYDDIPVNTNNIEDFSLG